MQFWKAFVLWCQGSDTSPRPVATPAARCSFRLAVCSHSQHMSKVQQSFRKPLQAYWSLFSTDGPCYSEFKSVLHAIMSMTTAPLHVHVFSFYNKQLFRKDLLKFKHACSCNVQIWNIVLVGQLIFTKTRHTIHKRPLLHFKRLGERTQSLAGIHLTQCWGMWSLGSWWDHCAARAQRRNQAQLCWEYIQNLICLQWPIIHWTLVFLPRQDTNSQCGGKNNISVLSFEEIRPSGPCLERLFQPLVILNPRQRPRLWDNRI